MESKRSLTVGKQNLGVETRTAAVHRCHVRCTTSFDIQIVNDVLHFLLHAVTVGLIGADHLCRDAGLHWQEPVLVNHDVGWLHTWLCTCPRLIPSPMVNLNAMWTNPTQGAALNDHDLEGLDGISCPALHQAMTSCSFQARSSTEQKPTHKKPKNKESNDSTWSLTRMAVTVDKDTSSAIKECRSFKLAEGSRY
jgi:hypothetical protein